MTQDNLHFIKSQISYSFKNSDLLKEALTHKSYLNEVREPGGKDNERMEYLGDAVLDLVISDTLFEKFPLSPEGELSKMKAKIVSERGLSIVAERISLGQSLYLGKGEEQTGGREKSSLLADALEAVIAAIYLDGGFLSSKLFILNTFKPELDIADQSNLAFDYKTELQEY